MVRNRIYLWKTVPFTLQPGSAGHLANRCRFLPKNSTEDNNSMEQRTCNFLWERLDSNFTPKDWVLTLLWGWRIETVDCQHPLRLIFSGDILDQLERFLFYGEEKEDLKIRVVVTLSREAFGEESVQYETDLERSSSPAFEYVSTCSRFKFPSPREQHSKRFWELISDREEWNATVSVILTFGPIKLPSVDLDQATNVNKMILETGVGCDVEIVGKEGVVIPCHKIYLISQSAVFRAMLGKSGFAEGVTMRIEMEYATEEEIRAFLAYLYWGDRTHALGRAGVAMTLCELGHKYDIRGLEGSMKEILLKKGFDWYDVDSAFRLFLFARLVDGEEELVRKAVDVLQMKPDDDIMASQHFDAAIKTEFFRLMRKKF